MNPKRILIALIVAFVAISATDYLIHEVWLKSTYAEGAGKLWRAEADMKGHMSGIFLGQFLIAMAFTLIWARIALGGAGLPCALALGFLLGLFYSGGSVITHAVQPLPEGLLARWIASGIAQSVLVGAILFFVYPPSKPAPAVSGH